jgi:hypothetical protein
MGQFALFLGRRLPRPSDVTFEGLEIRHARGPGVKIDDSKRVVLKSCTVSGHGMMGVNVTGGSGCGVQGSEVAGNGDAGVVLMGGDRATLAPGNQPLLSEIGTPETVLGAQEI